MHSPFPLLGRNGSQNTRREFTSTPTDNGPHAPSKVSSDSLGTSAFLRKHADATVRLSLVENLGVTVALSATFFSSTPTAAHTPSLAKTDVPSRMLASVYPKRITLR
ncbi:hypothetical protein TRVL_06435 [Trypanosoma vivax]|nr:hypothetical protein TRVL_06435 [Trypanosoma vivax]